MESKFTAPLLVWIRPARSQAVVKRICDVEAGIAALTRDGLGNYGLNNPDWHIALTVLSKAKVDPTPENVEAARAALRAVAKQTGTLLDG